LLFLPARLGGSRLTPAGATLPSRLARLERGGKVLCEVFRIRHWGPHPVVAPIRWTQRLLDQQRVIGGE
jgi:hypothetical protein